MCFDSTLFSGSNRVNFDTDVTSKIISNLDGSHCSICNQSFKCRQDYDNHEHFQSNVEPNKMSHERSIRCGNCKEVYHDKREFSKHISKSHEGRLLYMCSTCERTYEKWSSLDVHEATHKTDKLYLCDLCGKSFKHSNNLRSHKRIHLDESVKKRHVCAICGNSFRSR